MLREWGEGGWRDGGRDRLPELSTPPLALLPCRQGGRDKVRETQTDDKTGKREFLKREDQTRMTLFYHGSFKMGSGKHEHFSFLPFTV